MRKIVNNTCSDLTAPGHASSPAARGYSRSISFPESLYDSIADRCRDSAALVSWSEKGERRMGIADGKRALIVGVANDKSLAWSIAQELHAQGAEVALTFQGEILEKRVRPLAQQIGAQVVGELDVTSDEQIAAIFANVKQIWGGLDMLVHAVAFAEREDLRDRFLNVNRVNFARALEISAYSLVALARAAEPLMETRGGGSVVTLSYLGAVRALPNYNIMGVAKAALEACVRYLAMDLGPKNIRVNALSAAPARTLASSAIRDYHSMSHEVEERAPLKRAMKPEEVGKMATVLLSELSSGVTGQTVYVDVGYSIMG
jgi:enoyl-[acyl-carrier protein] reductase I